MKGEPLTLSIPAAGAMAGLAKNAKLCRSEARRNSRD